MSDLLISDTSEPTSAIRLLGETEWRNLVQTAPRCAAIAESARFAGARGDLALIPDEDGRLNQVLFGLGDAPMPRAMDLRGLAARLPAGAYRIDGAPAHFAPSLFSLAWALGTYRFDRYKQSRTGSGPRLLVPATVDIEEVRALARACGLARDMINTPANDMGPQHLEAIARDIAAAHGAEILVSRGDDLLAAGYPLVHAVGRAAVAERAPRIIEMSWGRRDRPPIVLVGKGVVFDSGGLDIKPSAGMRLMKKDMGGAAHALALAQLLMAADLPVRLHVLIPTVENAIAGDAMRPGDVVSSRNGLTVEVGNTDAEGRLILADALARAKELSPVLTIDLATLTGAARVALGPEIVPFYTEDDVFAAQLAASADAVDDPLWRMPLWQGYASGLDSEVADLKNDPDAWVQAGSVAAGLFLQRFAPPGLWVHFDIFAWNPRTRPGWPQGAEAQAIRALYAAIRERFLVTLLDPRLTLARADLATADLEGIAAAARYAPATPMRVVRPGAPVRVAPARDAGQLDELLFGEIFDQLELKDGFAWGRARRDGYVGFVDADALCSEMLAPTHWIAAIRTFAFEQPSIKSPSRGPLSLNALVSIEEETPTLALARGLGWIARAHVRPVGSFLEDPAGVASRFLGTPYLWGGRDSLGLDCSGLVQQALYACGRACPRDSDQQAALGVPASPLALRRGDLVFWRGHVGMMLDTHRLLHANAHHMAVTAEPLVEVEARIEEGGGGAPVAFRRL